MPFTIISMFNGSLPVFFHEEDAQDKGTFVWSEYKQSWKLLLPIYASEPYNKGEVAQTETDSEAGNLVWPCPVSYSSEWDGTLLNDSHKPWVTTDRKVNTHYTRSESKLHPLRHNNGLRSSPLFSNTQLLTMNEKIRMFGDHFAPQRTGWLPNGTAAATFLF